MIKKVLVTASITDTYSNALLSSKLIQYTQVCYLSSTFNIILVHICIVNTPPTKWPFNGVDSDAYDKISFFMSSNSRKRQQSSGGIGPINVESDDTILRTFILFAQTANLVRKYGDAHLYSKTSLSTIKFIVLKVLEFNGGTMSPSEIARWTNTERHNVTTLIRRLEQDGFVNIERNSVDKRFFNVTLTDEGLKVLSQATSVAREIVDKVMLSIGERDAYLLEKSLRVLRRNAHCGLKSVTAQSQYQSG